MVAKLCHGLRENVDHVIGGVDPGGRYPRHYFYAWFVFHCHSLHPCSRDLPSPDAPFMCRLATLLSPYELKTFKGFSASRSIIWNSDSFMIRDSSWFTDFDGDSKFCDAEKACLLDIPLRARTR
ncbi:hypothetical protein AAC387_Pa02g2518 [Persea americana]